MVIANNFRKEEALKLREKGVIITEIVTKTGLSKATLTRLFKSKGLTNNNLSLSHIKNSEASENNNEALQNDDQDDNEKVNTSIKSKLEVSEKGSEIVQSDAFKGSKVSYEKGNIMIESSDIEGIVSTLPTTPTPEPELIPGAFKHSAIRAEKTDIDAPDTILDSFYSRGLGETLLIGGMITCGFLMKKENDSSIGENIRKHGIGWLSGDKRSEDW